MECSLGLHALQRSGWFRPDFLKMRLIYSMADQTFERSASLGIFNFSRGLLDALARAPDGPDLCVLADSGLARQLPASPRLRGVVCDAPSRGRLGRLAWDHWGAYAAAGAQGGDWLLLPKGFASAVRRCPIKLAVYMHDIIPLIYPDRYPGYFPAWHAPYFSLVYRKTLQSADVIFTNTEFTKGEIVRWAETRKLQTPPVVVAGYGLDVPRSPAPRSAQDRIMVILRALPHKRPDLTVDYIERWRRERGCRSEIFAVGDCPRGISLPSDWRFEERMTASQHLANMAASRALVCFSEYEGFGLPPVEALLSGTAPVYSDIAPWREVLEGAGFPFQNKDYASFATALDSARGASSARLQEVAEGVRARYAWPRVCEKIMTAMRTR